MWCRASSRNLFYVSLVSLLFAGLVYFQYPKPWIDDLFYAGASINLVETGELNNRFLSVYAEQYKTSKFFQYPPLQTYVLAGYLRIMGIGTQQLVIFQCLNYLAFYVLLALLLKRFSFKESLLLALICLLVYLSWVLYRGLRPDAFGVVLLLLGLFLVSYKGLYFLCFSCLGMAVMSWPSTVFLCFGLGLAGVTIHILEANRQSLALAETRRIVLSAMGAATVLIGLLVWSVGGEVTSFWETFHQHASFNRSGNPWKELSGAVEKATEGKEWFLTLPLTLASSGIILAICFRYGRTLSLNVRLILAGFAIAELLNLLVLSRTFAFIGVHIWIAAFLLTEYVHQFHPPHRGFRAMAYSMMGLLFLLHLSPDVVSLLETEPVRPKNITAIQKLASELPEDRGYLIVDCVAARHVFDYKLPERTLTFGFARAKPATKFSSIHDRKPSEVWILSEPNVPLDFPELRDKERSVRFLGRRFPSIPKRPGRIYMIR